MSQTKTKKKKKAQGSKNEKALYIKTRDIYIAVETQTWHSVDLLDDFSLNSVLVNRIKKLL